MRRIRISVENRDVFSFECDVIALKYAQASFGVDKIMANKLMQESPEALQILPGPGKSAVFAAPSRTSAKQIIFVGVKSLFEFNYIEIRNFTKQVLTDAAIKAPQAKHIAFTLHGAGYGLDETEAFESEIAGIIDALDNGAFPPDLDQISIV
jgi:hypothetical protein